MERRCLRVASSRTRPQLDFETLRPLGIHLAKVIVSGSPPEDPDMSDDLKNRGPADRAGIKVNEPHELRYWTKALGCTEQQLRDAVKAVGVSVEKVRQRLA